MRIGFLQGVNIKMEFVRIAKLSLGWQPANRIIFMAFAGRNLQASTVQTAHYAIKPDSYKTGFSLAQAGLVAFAGVLDVRSDSACGRIRTVIEE